MISSKISESKPAVKKKTINVKDVHIENNTICDSDGEVLSKICEELKDDGVFSFKITVELPE